MNNKGFMFIETIVMVVILSVGLLVLYSAFNNSMSQEKRKLAYDDTPYIYKTYYLAKFLQDNTSINNVDSILGEDNYAILGEYNSIFQNVDNDVVSKFLSIKEDYHMNNILLISSDLIKNNSNNFLTNTEFQFLQNNFKYYIMSLNKKNPNIEKYFIVVEFGEKVTSDGNVESCYPNKANRDCKASYASIEISKSLEIVAPDIPDDDTPGDTTVEISVSIAEVTSNSITLNLVGENVETWYYSINNGSYVSTTSSTPTIGDLSSSTTYTIAVYGEDAEGNQSDTETLSANTSAYVFNGVYAYQATAYTETIEVEGYYKLQVWGAQGGYGDTSSYTGGKGGYSVGVVKLKKNDILYIHTGGQGTGGSTAGFKTGGTNGGGKSGYKRAGSGGGASDIRIKPSTALAATNYDTYYARVIVAGGGGGASYHTDGVAGGGTSGIAGNAGAGTANSGGSGATATLGTTGSSGTFGSGGDAANLSADSNYGSGGGGGWYGGGGGGGTALGTITSTGGGGSGFVYTSSTASNVPSGWLLTGSTYYLTSASTTAGNTSFPSTSGGTETGHEGDGYAKVTYCGSTASSCS